MSVPKAATSAFKQINGVVVSAGLMSKTVKIRIGGQIYDKHIRKLWNQPSHLLVHDPRSSLRIGDVITASPGWRVSKHVRHVVTSIIAPFGDPLEARPPVPSEEERLEERAMKKKVKDERRAKRRSEVKTEDEVKNVVQEIREKEKRVKGVNPPKKR